MRSGGEMLLSSEGSSIPVRIPRKGRARFDRFAIFYGIVLTAFLLAALSQATYVIEDYSVELLLCTVVGILSIYGQLLSLRREASIHFISFVFCFLFLSAAPIVQIGSDAAAVFHIGHLPLWAALNALAFTVIGVVASYRLRTPDDKPPSRSQSAPSGVNYLFVFLVTVIASSIAIVLFRDALFTSREEFGFATSEVFSDSAMSLLIRMFLFNTPFYGAIIGLRASIANRQKIWTRLFFFAMVMVAIVNNPLINARYQLAGLAFFALDYMFYGKKTKLLAILLVVGVLLAPAFQVFRRGVSATESPEDSTLFGSTLLSKDYDSFQMSCYTILTVDTGGIAWGSNILGATLFFVPRAWWPGKPVPTSWITFETAEHSSEQGTNNLSTPLMAEGYFAFGWIGALLISLLYWWFISTVTLLSRRDPDSWAFLARCLFAGLTLIFLRGTLTVGVSAVVGSLFAAAIPAFLIKHRFATSRRY
jgi:hypothetical protein